MEPGSSMSHSQELSSNSYPEPNQPNSSYWYLFLRSILRLILFSHLPLGLPKVLPPAGVPVKILKALKYFYLLPFWLRNIYTVLIISFCLKHYCFSYNIVNTTIDTLERHLTNRIKQLKARKYTYTGIYQFKCTDCPNSIWLKEVDLSKQWYPEYIKALQQPLMEH